MAPKKTKRQEPIEPSSSPLKKMKKVAASSPALTRSKTQRVTRSSVAAASSTTASLLSLPEKPPKKKLKKSPKKANQKKSEEEDEEEEEIVPSNGSSSSPPPPKRNTKKSKGKSPPSDDVSISKTVVIEHCKQCNAFKTRANQVKDGLETGVPGIKVVINPEKPRRGCFEIREEGGQTFITLLNMKRPFPDLKALKMDEVISDIVEKLT